MHGKMTEPKTVRGADEVEQRVLAQFEPETREKIQQARDFGDHLRQTIRRLRTQADKTQKEIAERLGVSVSTISRLERGQGLSGLDMEVAMLTLAELGVSPMLTLVGPRTPGAGEVVDLTDQMQTVFRVKARGEPGEVTIEGGAGASQDDADWTATSPYAQAMAIGVQSELEAVRIEMSRISQTLSDLVTKRSTG